jgi:HK97 family phage major capsid protein
MKLDEKRLREKRAVLIAAMQALAAKATVESRGMTPEEDLEWSRMDTEQEQLRGQIAAFDRERSAGEEAAAMNEQLRRAAVDDPSSETRGASSAEREAAYVGAFTDWLRGGNGNLRQEQREALHRRMQAIDTPQEARALATGIGASGGFLIPEGFSNTLERATLVDDGGGGARERLDRIRSRGARARLRELRRAVRPPLRRRAARILAPV